MDWTDCIEVILVVALLIVLNLLVWGDRDGRLWRSVRWTVSQPGRLWRRFLNRFVQLRIVRLYPFGELCGQCVAQTMAAQKAMLDSGATPQDIAAFFSAEGLKAQDSIGSAERQDLDALAPDSAQHIAHNPACMCEDCANRKLDDFFAAKQALEIFGLWERTTGG